MANLAAVRKIEKVTINLGDKTRVIHFDLNGFAELEKRFGTIQAAMQALQSGMMKNIKVILWAGLIHEEVTAFDEDGEPTGYNITPYQVGHWVTPNLMPQISSKLGEAMGFAMPPVDSPEFKKQLEAAGIQLPEGEQLAVVVMTEEEKAAAAEAEVKNV